MHEQNFPGVLRKLTGIITEMLSLTAIIPFPMQNSASRAVMTASQYAQALTLVESDERRVQTGIEKDLGKYTFKIEMPVDGVILDVIAKYPKTLGPDSIESNPETTIIYQDSRTLEVGSFVIPYFCRNHQHFGFVYKTTKNMELLRPNVSVPKGTVFADSPAIKENGGYCIGRNLNVLFNTAREGTDDGIWISESTAKKFAYTVIDRRTLQCGNKQYPKNLYGNKDVYQPFPKLGQRIRDDGLLAAFADYDSDTAPVTMSVNDLMVPDMVYDSLVYVRGGGGVVVDIRVIRNNEGRSTTPTGMMDKFDKYSDAYQRYLEKLIDSEKKHRNEYKRKYNRDDLTISDNFHRQLVEAMKITNGYGTRSRGSDKQEARINLLHRQAVLDDYTIEFDILYTLIPDVGNKATEFHGAKGIIVKVSPDHLMPRDVAGNVADIILALDSRNSRMNLGGVTEMTLGGVIRDICRQMRRELGLSEDQNKKYSNRDLRPINEEMLRVFDELLLPFYGHVNPLQYEHYRALREDPSRDEDLLEHIRVAINDEPMVLCNPENEYKPNDIIRNIMNDSRIEIVRGPLIYPKEDGTEEIGENIGQIGKMHFMLLNKIADEGSAVASGRLHHSGILGQLTKNTKYTMPFRETPVRLFGETEIRLLAAMKDKRLVAEIMDRNNNPETHAMIVRQFIESETPTNIPLLVDRNIHPYGQTKPLQNMRSFFTCLGIGLSYNNDL